MGKIFFDKNLYFILYTVGYHSEGECIIFFVFANDMICYSGLIDCYESISKSVVVDILKKNGIRKLNFICWTHPHDDHTKGMSKILDNWCDKNTQFFIPEIPIQSYNLYSEESKEVYERVMKIHKKKDETNMCIKHIANDTILEKIIFSEPGGREYLFQITSYAPISTLLKDFEIRAACKDVIKKGGNLYSIGLKIEFGKFVMLLGGDVENHTWDRISKYAIPDVIDYIKIPHHASSTGGNLLSKIGKNNVPQVAVSTVFRKHSLPNTFTLKAYKNVGVKDVLVTSDINDSKSEGCGYGIIKTEFDILEKAEYPVETTLVGEAVAFGEC